MANKRLVVVANSSKARFFYANNNSQLWEEAGLINLKSAGKSSDLTTDKEGRYRESGLRGMHATEPRLTPKKNQAITFARQLSDAIEKCCRDESPDGLYIVAAPEFLGRLRPVLGVETQKLLKDEVAKDVTLCSPGDIRDHLPFVL